MIRKMIVLVAILAILLMATAVAFAGDPSQWGMAQAGDPSQWGVTGDPSQWG